eukprot:TRINITY_DN50134_c0_g1_i1.p2 TRINITY_DN50134_c0_g1~~TRINITY_DN50134_c0_g1_i1.p2  ORF type:complete len:202 (-),score=35.16 TRINITY_DN50134_c0_g1_i1:332-937(-)
MKTWLGGNAAQPPALVGGFNTMKKIAIIAVLAVFLIGACFTLAEQALAGDLPQPQDVASIAPGNATSPVTSKNMPVYLDEKLVSKHADFTLFAKSRIHALNRSHRLAKSRMQITRQADGSFLARYHIIDDDTVSCRVSRSNSKTIPYVAVLRFKEVVMEAVAITPEECRQAKFAPVSVIPNRQIFSYKKGTWQQPAHPLSL